jgi:threonine dehydrogenase-like Zn-dependent dehydrogenase
MSRHLVDLTKVVTHRFPLTDALEAFELGKKGGERSGDSAKILLIP